MREYPKYVKFGLWLLIEVGVIAATVPGGIEFVFVHQISSYVGCFERMGNI
jgi:natural resistance-associated macrophage protein